MSKCYPTYPIRPHLPPPTGIATSLLHARSPGSPSAKTHGRLGGEGLVDLVDVDVLDLQTSLMADS